MGKSKVCKECKIKDAAYGHKDGIQAGTRLYCRGCRDKIDPSMINLKGYICANGSCIKRAAYGYNKGDDNLYCGECAKKIDPNMKNILNKMCEKCGLVQPNYNKEGEKKGRFCKGCVEPDMVDVKSKKCKTCKTITATYGCKGGKKLYCATHAKKGMRDLGKIYCEKCDETIANWNFPNESKGRFCSKCAEDGMIDLINENCIWPGCKLSTCYAKDMNSKKEYCADHGKNMGYILKTYQKCKLCPRNPSYGMPDDEKPTYCASHALKGMINIKATRCEMCDTVATWNYEGERPIRCKPHAEPKMIDVTATICDECKTTAGYSYPGHIADKCASHKIDGMIVDPRRRCKEEHCNNFAIYGTTTHTHCEDHKKQGQFNLVEKICQLCGLLMILNEQQLCGFCDLTMIKNLRLAKQKDIKKMLDMHKFHYISHDSIIDTKCGKERPDFLFDAGDHHVVLEIDEHSHKTSGYNDECERVRMINISQMLGPTVFIRFNPDVYRVDGKIQNTSLSKRYSVLRAMLTYYIKKPVDKLEFLSVCYLYYDDFDQHDVKIKPLWKWNAIQPIQNA